MGIVYVGGGGGGGGGLAEVEFDGVSFNVEALVALAVVVSVLACVVGRFRFSSGAVMGDKPAKRRLILELSWGCIT